MSKSILLAPRSMKNRYLTILGILCLWLLFGLLGHFRSFGFVHFIFGLFFCRMMLILHRWIRDQDQLTLYGHLPFVYLNIIY